MSSKLTNWIRSKTGITVIAGVIVLAVITVFAGQQLGWWATPGAAGLPPDPVTCGTLPTNYNVENPVSTPFYGIKYVFASGEPVKRGAADNFSFVLPAEVAKSLSVVTVNVQAGTYTGQVTIDGCAFAGPEACNEPIQDPTRRFYYQFVGSTDNGDGTLSLRFWVQVMIKNPLSSVTFSLPDGVIPSSPVGTYTGATCPTAP